MRRYPEQLRSVILDSVAPAHIKLYENLGQPNVEALLSLFYFCEVDPDCQKAYPDLQERFVALLDKLDGSRLQRWMVGRSHRPKSWLHYGKRYSPRVVVSSAHDLGTGTG